MTHKRNRQQWRKIIKEHQQSGLSISSFCRERGLQEERFHYWKQRLKVLADSPQPIERLDSETSFIEMTFEKPDMPSGITLRHGRLSIELSRDFDQDCLTQVLSVLEVSV